MMVTAITPVKRLAIAVLLLLGLEAAAFAAEGPKPRRPGDPAISIPLETLGVEVAQPRLLLDGSTMFSLNFVDETHLLVTFHTHGLLPRMPDEPPDDEDRFVTALLVELPSGNVLARTRWHTHDHEQYLFPLSHGLFLLRIRDRLTVIDPMRNLTAGEPFRQETFLDLKRRIGYIAASPGGELLVIETVPPRKQDPESAVAASAQTAADDHKGTVVVDTAGRPSTQIHFFRMVYSDPGTRPVHVVAQSAGMLLAHGLVRIPATAEGFLDVSKESAMTWLFDFQSHAGKKIELAPFDTSCAPTPYFVSRSEFVAFGCDPRDQKSVAFSGFNFRGEQPWIQILGNRHLAPQFATAPDAGRFAFSRIVTANSYMDGTNLQPDDLTSQEIQILQSYDGRVLLKVKASPIQRSGQNFDLSPDGLNFTVIRGDNVEVYRLPELTARDQAQLKLAVKDFPDRNEARIQLKSAQSAKERESAQPNLARKAAAMSTTQTVRETPAMPVEGTPAVSAPSMLEPDVPRTPPSLYDADHPKPPKS